MNSKIFRTKEGLLRLVQGALVHVEGIFVHLEGLFTIWITYLHFLSKSRLRFWKPALFALMKAIIVLAESGLIDNYSRLIELVEATFAVLDNIFALVETSLIYTCRGFICACGILIYTCSSLICIFVSHTYTCGKLIFSWRSPICTCGSFICTCDF